MTTADLALHEKLDGLLALTSAPEEDVAWLLGMIPRLMWQFTDRPAGMTGILWRRLAQLYGVEFEALVTASTADALAAARAALPNSPLTRLERGELDQDQLRRDLCGDL